jgi:sugar phosphate isomerase/epimerase
MPLSRRTLLSGALASSAALLTGLRPARAAEAGHPICLFTKPFQSLSFGDLARLCREAGYQGIEAPVRKGGHIEPERAEEELPKLVEALKAEGLECTILASSIGRADDPLARKTLNVASALGIRRYRLAHLKYDLNRPILPQIASLRPRFGELAALNRELKIQGLYQNHAGASYVGAPVWDLLQLLNGVDPAHLGVAYDIRHATVEGGTTWPLTWDVIAPHLGAVYIKDFRWDGRKIVNVPLGEGIVDPKFFAMLKTRGFDGPISLHEEYIDHRDPALVPRHREAVRTDLVRLKKLLADAGTSGLGDPRPSAAAPGKTPCGR